MCVEPIYPEPQDDPKGYSDYLRRQVVALARKYLVEHGHRDLCSEHSYTGIKNPTLEHVAAAIKELDEWKREFKLTEID